MGFGNSMTLAELMTAVRERAGMENSTFISDTELKGYINSGLFELYGLLTTEFEDYNLSFGTVTTDGTNERFSLPADFFKVRGVDIDLGSSCYRPILPFTLIERGGPAALISDTDYRYKIVGSQIWFSPKPANGKVFRLIYTPRFTALSANSDTADGYSGWLEYVLVYATRKCLVKEESDVRELDADLANLRERIVGEAARRDSGHAGRVSDVYAPENIWPFSY